MKNSQALKCGGFYREEKEKPGTKQFGVMEAAVAASIDIGFGVMEEAVWVPKSVVDAVSRRSMRASSREAAVLAWLASGGQVNATFEECPEEEGSLRGTALMFSAENGHSGLVDVLLQHGAEINQQDFEGMTPLMNAAYNGHPSLVLRLLQAGADPEPRCLSGTALQMAKEKGHAECVRTLEEHAAAEAATKEAARAAAAAARKAERAAAEAEANRHATELLAEIEAEKESEERAKESKKKKKKKKKKKGGGGEAGVSACSSPTTTAASAPPPPTPIPPPPPADSAAVAAADEALQQAVTAGSCDGLASALEACSSLASPAVLAEARRARDKLISPPSDAAPPPLQQQQQAQQQAAQQQQQQQQQPQPQPQQQQGGSMPGQQPGQQPMQLMLATVPPNVHAGEQMIVMAPAGQQYMIVVPQGAGPNSQFQIAVPRPPEPAPSMPPPSAAAAAAATAPSPLEAALTEARESQPGSAAPLAQPSFVSDASAAPTGGAPSFGDSSRRGARPPRVTVTDSPQPCLTRRPLR